MLTSSYPAGGLSLGSATRIDDESSSVKRVSMLTVQLQAAGSVALSIAAAGCASGGFGGHGLVIAVRAFDQSADDSSPALAADLFVIPLVDWNKHRLQDAWLRLGEGDAQRAQFLESLICSTDMSDHEPL